MRKLIVLVALIILSQASFSYALDVETHKAINEYIAKNNLNGFLLDTYLRNNLGIQGGITEKFNISTVWEWLRDGGKYEDKPPWTIPYLRSVNHFHNPLTDQGFSGFVSGYLLSGESSVQWAQKPEGTQSPGGYYSWHDVRSYYNRALTSTDQNARSSNFAEIFRGLGQLMHLVQDLSVPEHTRDDFHLLYNYEDWVKEKANIFSYNPIFFDLAALGQPSAFQISPLPIANLFDTNQYTQATGPNATIVPNIGLAEYTAANFLSWDTMFTLEFPYPGILSVEKWKDPTYSRQYLKKSTVGVPVDHLAVTSYLYFYRLRFFPQYNEFLPLGMDSNVYRDYASLLLPRAIGYSASLLNYFFRGKLDFVLDEGNRGDGITGIRIYNLSNEEMDGTFSLYYDATDGNRYLLGSWSLLLSPQGLSTGLSFPVPNNNNIEEDRYIIVFSGRMGSETGAVAGYIHGGGWREEWDAGLYDIHNWVYSETNMVGQNPNNGITVNEIVSGRLVKENIRYAGSDMARTNETYIGVADDVINGTYYLGGYAIPYDFTDRFPMQVTSETWLSLKIDAMSINEPIPAQSCAGTEWPTGAYQGISFEFRFGDGSTRKMVFTTLGHESLIWPTIVVTTGVDYSINVYELLAAWGGITEPVSLDSINIIQQMWNLCAPSQIEHRQHMEVDYIRLENR